MRSSDDSSEQDRVKALKKLPRPPWVQQRRAQWTRAFLATTQFPEVSGPDVDALEVPDSVSRCMLFGDHPLTQKLIRRFYSLGTHDPLPTYWQDPHMYKKLMLMRHQDLDGPWEATSGGGCGGTASKLSSANVYIISYDNGTDFVDEATRLFLPGLFDANDELLPLDTVRSMPGYENISRFHTTTTELVQSRSTVTHYPHCKGPAVYPSLELDFVVFLGFNSMNRQPTQEQRLRKRAKILGEVLWGNECRVPFIWESLGIFPYSRYGIETPPPPRVPIFFLDGDDNDAAFEQIQKICFWMTAFRMDTDLFQDYTSRVRPSLHDILAYEKKWNEHAVFLAVLLERWNPKYCMLFAGLGDPEADFRIPKELLRFIIRLLVLQSVEL